MRDCCYKRISLILPSIFGEELTYLEKFCKIAYELGEMAKQLDLTNQEMAELKQYVNNYFNNLDVSAEVKKQFDLLVNQGYFDQFFQTTLSGKKVAFFGDSLTYGLLPGGGKAINNIPAVFAKLTGATVDNYAVPGAKCAQVAQAERPWLINQIQSADLSKYDYIFFNIGTNDETSGDKTGSYDDTDVTTFVGAFKGVLNYLIQYKKPESKIYFYTTPTYKSMLTKEGARNGYMLTPLSIMLCRLKNISYIDLNIGTGVSPDIISQYNDITDSLHFNENGYLFYGTLLSQRFKAYTPYPIFTKNNLLVPNNKPLPKGGFVLLNTATIETPLEANNFYTINYSVELNNDSILIAYNTGNGTSFPIARLKAGVNKGYSGFYAESGGPFRFGLGNNITGNFSYFGIDYAPNFATGRYQKTTIQIANIPAYYDGYNIEASGLIIVEPNATIDFQLTLPKSYYANGTRYISGGNLKNCIINLVGDKIAFLDDGSLGTNANISVNINIDL